MRSRSFSVLFCVALLFCGSLMAQGQSSTPISLTSDQLLLMLLQQTQSLPNQIEAFRTSLTGQINSLQQNVTSLQNDNASLTASNSISDSLNKELQVSLDQSRADLATSEQAQKVLQTSLQKSIDDTTKAQADAKALEAENGLMKYGYLSLGVLLAGAGAYEGGHALRWW